MKSFFSTLENASLQFIGRASPELLLPNAKRFTAAAVLALGSSMAAAQGQYVWGDGTGSGSGANNQEPILAPSTVSRWGGIMGSVLGRAAAVSVVGSSGTSEIARAAQSAVSGIAEEVGRNVGRSASQQPYKQVAVPLAERDTLDTAGLNALFASGRANEQLRKGNWNDPAYRDAMTQRDESLRSLERVTRVVSERGYVVTPWTDLRSALALNGASEAQLVKLAEPMAARLHRPGGPGYTAQATVPARTLGAMLENMHAQQRANTQQPSP